MGNGDTVCKQAGSGRSAFGAQGCMQQLHMAGTFQAEQLKAQEPACTCTALTREGSSMAACKPTSPPAAMQQNRMLQCRSKQRYTHSCRNKPHTTKGPMHHVC